MCGYVCHIFPIVSSPWWWQCMTLSEYFSHCRFWFSGLWTLEEFGDAVADPLDACVGHGPALQGSSSPISMTSGKDSLSLVALFSSSPFFLFWTLDSGTLSSPGPLQVKLKHLFSLLFNSQSALASVFSNPPYEQIEDGTSLPNVQVWPHKQVET